MKTIGIDARMIGPRCGGIGRYIQSLLEEIEKSEESNKFTFKIFLKKENFHLFNSTKKNFQKIVADYEWYSIQVGEGEVTQGIWHIPTRLEGNTAYLTININIEPTNDEWVRVKLPSSRSVYLPPNREGKISLLTISSIL